MNTHKVVQTTRFAHVCPTHVSYQTYFLRWIVYMFISWDGFKRMTRLQGWSMSNQLFRSDGDPSPNHASVCPLSGCVSPEKWSENDPGRVTWVSKHRGYPRMTNWIEVMIKHEVKHEILDPVILRQTCTQTSSLHHFLISPNAWSNSLPVQQKIRKKTQA
jgi:hypothetical protein